MNPDSFGSRARSAAIAAARSVILVLLGALAGCVTVPADRGRGDVDDWVRERGRDVPRSTHPDAGSRAGAESDVAALARAVLRQPLTAEDSVRVALLGNPDVRATYARLEFAAADLYQSGRLANPRFSAALLDSDIAGEQLTLGFALRFVDLLFLPSRARIGAARFTQAKQEVAHEVLQLAARAEESHYRLVAAQQVAAMRDLAASAASASAELAQRFHAAGNISRLELAREQAAGSEARLAALAAQSELTEARSGHARILGLSPSATWSVENGLRTPPASDPQVDALVSLAQISRLDLSAARGTVESLAALDRDTRRTRVLSDVEIGVERERETDGERLTGPTLSLGVPLFGFGTNRSLRAGGELERARAALAGLELDVAHEVRLGHARTQTARARAEEFRSVLVPARESIVARLQEEMNYMLVGQFEVLAARRSEYEAYGGYIESVRDYWLARVELARVVGTRLPDAPAAGAGKPIAIPEPGEEAKPEEEHRHHESTGGAP
jgi:outer membrane protein, heavy metal efflux system